MYLLENVIPAPLWANVTWGENLKKGREKDDKGKKNRGEM
jgi:hypothetical protein